MKRRALFVLATLVLAACEDTAQPQLTASFQSPQFARLNVPGDFSSIQAAHDDARARFTSPPATRVTSARQSSTATIVRT